MKLFAALLAAVVVLPSGVPSAAPASCTSHTPFSGFAGADLEPTRFVSSDTPPVAYEMWRGTVPSFDGMPMSVDVTIPCGSDAPLPLVTMNHGWTDDKTIWEETGRSDTVSSAFRRGSNHHWNNIWFASKGYAVLNYTARGWHDSCGPRTPGARGQVAPADHCLAFDYWIHMDDQRWEIRDVQWLTAGLVESGVADPEALAITGGSYGGGVTVQAALLNNRVVCGGAAVPAELGADPCAGKPDGAYETWRTRDGSLDLRWAVAIPMYTWGDVIQTLLPNGRGSDGVLIEDGDHAEPVGIPIQSYLVGLYAAGQPLGNGYFAPPGVDPTADITTLSARALAGDPFRNEDPLVARGIEQFRRFKSAIRIEPNGIVPIMWVQGFTDPLFTALEPIQIANKLFSYDEDYPIKLFFGDLGHDYAAERVDEWDAAKAQMNALLDHHLTGAGPAPEIDAAAAVTRCLEPNAPMEIVTGPDWASLAPGRFVSTWDAIGVTRTGSVGPTGFETDPVMTATIPGPQSYKGCRIRSPIAADPEVVVRDVALPNGLVMMGGPLVTATFSVTAPGAQLNARMWDLDHVSNRQGLVTRGTYRIEEGPGASLTISFQLAPNGYRFLPGHSLRLELTGNDAPYRQTNNVAATIVVESVELTVPSL